MVENSNNDNKSSSPPPPTHIEMTSTPEESLSSYNNNDNGDHVDGENSYSSSSSFGTIYNTINNNNNMLSSLATPVDTAIPVNVVSPPPPFSSNNNNNNSNSNSEQQHYQHTATLNDIVDESERSSVTASFDFTGSFQQQDGSGSVGVEASLIGNSGSGSIASLDEIAGFADEGGETINNYHNNDNNNYSDCEEDEYIDNSTGFLSPKYKPASASSTIPTPTPVPILPPILSSSAVTPKATGGGLLDEISLSSHSSTVVPKPISSSSFGSGNPVRIYVHPTPPPSPGQQQQQQFGPQRPSRIHTHSINRPVEEKPLLDEIREVLAQSYLIFLLSDLRLLSGTGRIGTKYEHLAVDSDHYKRVTSKQIAGCWNDDDDDDDEKDKVYPKGLSPAVIMAILILEIRDTFAKTVDEKNNNNSQDESKKNKRGKGWAYSSKRNMNIDTEQSFVGYKNDNEKKKMLGESMESMMRAYARMISEDLVADIPNIRRRRATMNMMVGNMGGLNPHHGPITNNSPRWSSVAPHLNSTMSHLKMPRRGSAGPGVPKNYSTSSDGGGATSSLSSEFERPSSVHEDGRASSLGDVPTSSPSPSSTPLPPPPVPLPSPVGYPMSSYSPRMNNSHISIITNNKNKKKPFLKPFHSKSTSSKKGGLLSLKPVRHTLDNSPSSSTNHKNYSKQTSTGTAGTTGGETLGSVLEETESELGFEHYQHHQGGSCSVSSGDCVDDGESGSIYLIPVGENENENETRTKSSIRRENNSNHTHVSFQSTRETEEECPQQQQQQRLEGATTQTTTSCTTPTAGKSILRKKSFFPIPKEKDNNNIHNKRGSGGSGGGGSGSATTTSDVSTTYENGSINNQYNRNHNDPHHTSSSSSTHTLGIGGGSDRLSTATNRERYYEFKNPLNRENTKQMADRLKSRKDVAMNNWNDQVENMLPLNREAATKKEFEELTDVFFDQGETNEDITNNLGARYTRKEMVDAMRQAVETRNDGRLQFLSKLFKNGSVSRLLVQSHARVVWMNDWYPLKDLTYAISVDALQRRVMVVFRGAITASDWQSATDMKFHKIQNPIQDDFEGKKETLRVFSGLYTYLFRKRKDTGTTKYTEIANMVHKFGLQRIGPDYKLFVTGHSLGGALTHFFSFYASCEERFIRNGPVKAIAFASPYIGGHSWADSIRHQERSKKLQIVQVRNHSDAIPRLPANFRIGKRGPLWRHVGIMVTLPRVSRWMQWKPMVHYWGKEKSCWASIKHLSRRNIVFHFSYLRPWTLQESHTLFELQDRLMYGELNSEPGGDFELLQSTLDQLYVTLEEHDFETFRKTKRWGRYQK